jgi:Tfp pilus assembly protein PilX
MSSSVKALVGLLVVVVIGIAAALGLAAVGGGGHATKDPRFASARETAKKRRFAKLEARLKEAEEQKRAAGAKREKVTARAAKENHPAASAGTNGSNGQSSSTTPSGGSSVTQRSSFAALESEVSGEIGVAYAPLGSASVTAVGAKQEGHAWSSFKVPITVALMQVQGGKLSSSQESLAASAITASDNDAAASLFSDLESATGGKASTTIHDMLAQVDGGTTEVATAPPPPGAVSSWGQTNWTLSSSTLFYGSMYCGAFGAVSNVVGDMESVIPEQQWGLGAASFPSGTTVAFKAGWGPDGSESGPYLVRQAGIIERDGKGVAVTLAAQDSSGSFEAGVSDLDRVADWVDQNVPLGGSC